MAVVAIVVVDGPLFDDWLDDDGINQGRVQLGEGRVDVQADFRTVSKVYDPLIVVDVIFEVAHLAVEDTALIAEEREPARIYRSGVAFIGKRGIGHAHQFFGAVFQVVVKDIKSTGRHDAVQPFGL